MHAYVYYIIFNIYSIIVFQMDCLWIHLRTMVDFCILADITGYRVLC